jgi:hypothetical protein
MNRQKERSHAADEQVRRRGGSVEPTEKKREGLEGSLEEALEESFPASDPANVTQPPQSKQEKKENQ